MEVAFSRTATVLAVLIAGAMFIPQAHAELIVNGSFEAPALGANKNYFQLLNAGSNALPGWTIGGKSIDVLGVGNPYVSGTPADGQQYVDLVGSPGPGTLSQTFSTVAGQQYELSFAYAHNYNGLNGSENPISQALVELLGGATLLSESLSHSDSVAGDLKWIIATYIFTADSNSTTLRFSSQGVGSSGYAGLLLDNVSVTALTTPEPASLAVWSLLGAAGLAYRWRRKRTSVA